MKSQETSRIMALAAVCQAAELVRLIARKSTISDEQLKVMLNSITLVDADEPLQIYGSLTNLNLGYQVLCQQLGHQGKKDLEVTGYIMSALTLERKLANKPAALGQLADRINDLKRQLTHFDLLDTNTVANIANIYTDIISPLGRRIQVNGTEQFLKVESNQHKIRALLLSAVRAAVLWRQLGGKRRQLILSRQAIVNVAQQAIADI
jgi:high frequency lysogenization protein